MTMKKILMITILAIVIAGGSLGLHFLFLNNPKPTQENTMNTSQNTNATQELIKKQETTDSVATTVYRTENDGPEKKDSDTESVTLSFAGDVLLDGHIGTMISQKGAGYILSGVKQVFDSSDLTMINLENPVSNRGLKEKDKQFTFRAKPEHLGVLTEGGIDVVTLANNHVLDFGVEGFLDTMTNLNGSRISCVGAGKDEAEAYQPLYLDKKGVRLAFIASSRVIPFTTWAAGVNKPGVSTTYDPGRLKKEIVEAKKQADIVVIYVHWGEELKEMPVDHQKKLARAYIDSGADIVIGSHPHILEGFEFYKGKVIAFSLGNFVFTDMRKDTMILNLTVDKSGVSQVKVIPCEINQYRPTVVSDTKHRKAILSRLQALSIHSQIDDNGTVTQMK